MLTKESGKYYGSRSSGSMDDESNQNNNVAGGQDKHDQPSNNQAIKEGDASRILKLQDDSIEQNVEKHGVVSGDSPYPVTWLPAMVNTSESQQNSQNYQMEPPGAFVQIPHSYGGDASKFIGLVIGPNTVVPLDSFTFMNLQGNLAKISSGGFNSIDGNELGDNLHGLVKVDAEGNIENPGELTFSNLSGEHSSIKEAVYCIYCTKVYKTASDLRAHMLIEHSENSHLDNYVQDQSIIHASLRTCPGCGHQLQRVSSFEPSYQMNPNDDDPNLGLTGQEGILMVCEHCCKEFTLGPVSDVQPPPMSNHHNNELNMHLNSDLPKRHYCEHCGKSYKHNRDLRKHLRTHHGIDNTNQNVSSSQGVFSSGNNSASQSLFQSDHPPPSAKLPCEICNKMFRGPFELRRHVHTVHENKRPYKCKDCGKVFRDAYELKRHSASHQRLQYHNVANSATSIDSSAPIEMIHLPNVGETHTDTSKSQSNAQQLAASTLMRDVYNVSHSNSNYCPTGVNTDYYCLTCDKNFRGANEFKRHYSVVHEKKYRYKCIHCGKLWRDQYDLKRHCRRSHFVNQEIDKAFIRQCLLDNSNENNVSVPSAVSLSNYDMPQSLHITLNHEAAAAIFGATEQDCVSDHNMNRDALNSPSATMFQGITGGMPCASMLYSSEDNSHVGSSMIRTEDITLTDSTKDTDRWHQYDTDIKRTHD